MKVAARLRAPLLLIAGAEDRISPVPSNAAFLKKARPAARLEVLPGIGHLPHLEVPQRVDGLLAEFFR